YGAEGPDEACPLLSSYGVRFVVVGERERRRYGPGAGRFASAVPPVFSREGTRVHDAGMICGSRPADAGGAP
ncbi:MAG TPA: hypothetical protein VN898_01980, partial [Candidatus Binatia bacterium]|nr:hypothetical protein [Candidatus Binatia bacterium]